jgi:hypothetical protein
MDKLKRIEELERELAHLKAVIESENPKKGDWCVFSDTANPFIDNRLNGIGQYWRKKENGGHQIIGLEHSEWKNCRKLTPADFGWNLDNRPRWEDAPVDANWLAQNYDGSWWWYEKQPYAKIDCYCASDERCKWKADRNPDWKLTLEKRS